MGICGSSYWDSYFKFLQTKILVCQNFSPLEFVKNWFNLWELVKKNEEKDDLSNFFIFILMEKDGLMERNRLPYNIFIRPKFWDD